MSSPPGFHFFRFVFRNLANRPSRNIATVFVFALVAGILFSSQFLIAGAEQSLDAGMSRMGADILVVPEEYVLSGESILITGEPSSFFFEDTGYEKIARIPGVAKASPQIYIATLFASCCAAPVQMIAIDPATDFTVATWLLDHKVTMGKDEIIIGSSIIQNPGNDLMFYGHNFHVVGWLEPTGMGMDNAVFTRFEDAYVMADESGEKAVQKLTIPEGMVSAVVVKVEPGASVDEVAREIRRQVPGTKTIVHSGLLSAVNAQLGALTGLLFASTLAVAVVAVPLLGVVSAMTAHERRREISVLRALGAGKGFVARLMLAEAFSLALIGGLIGIATSAGLLVIYQDYLMHSVKIPFIIPSPLSVLAGGGIALALVIGIAGISSLYPVLRATRLEPYEAIRRGEL
ncbi:putative ABC transport system permease protein [Methanolinea mesophila]|uniref:ABC transporter permease n=1 Tax=Methanolinea mesophila TaxID=547055 RepID=UPI001AE73B0D|nr:FtsX-like permease family protein [Methanolinea mesophila]MBP1928336.1 putative ABC transport system permease protein [Methanolinea mesophila]